MFWHTRVFHEQPYLIEKDFWAKRRMKMVFLIKKMATAVPKIAIRVLAILWSELWDIYIFIKILNTVPYSILYVWISNQPPAKFYDEVVGIYLWQKFSYWLYMREVIRFKGLLIARMSFLALLFNYREDDGLSDIETYLSDTGIPRLKR